jgi:hypothetical protein
MRSFGFTTLAFLTLGVFSYAAPIAKGNDDSGLVNIDVDAEVSVLRRGDSDNSGLVDVGLELGVDVLRRGDSDDSGLVDVDLELGVDVLRRGYSDDAVSLMSTSISM